MPFHRAKKKANCVDLSGRIISTNAIKFERFIFDLLPAAENAIVVEAIKEQAFAPVKNSNEAPSDTPQAAQRAMIELDAAMLREAGVNVIDGTDVEVNPRWALNADDITRRMKPGLSVSKATYFDANDDLHDRVH